MKAARAALKKHPRGNAATIRAEMRKGAAIGSPTVYMTDAQREAILASQKRSNWFDPQTGTLMYAPGMSPGERRRR